MKQPGSGKASSERRSAGDGKRPVTSEEVAYFNRYYFDCYEDTSCFQHLLFDSPLISTEPVAYGEGFGRFFENNWYRDYIYLDEKLVRITDGGLEYEPGWDPDLGLFIWNEGQWVFFMDQHGHYRRWHTDFSLYIGKVSTDVHLLK